MYARHLREPPHIGSAKPPVEPEVGLLSRAGAHSECIALLRSAGRGGGGRYGGCGGRPGGRGRGRRRVAPGARRHRRRTLEPGRRRRPPPGGTPGA
eukprot:gene18292-biopygen18957